VAMPGPRRESPREPRGRAEWTRQRAAGQPPVSLMDAVMCVLRGQSLDAVSRKYGVSLHDLTKWRDKVLSGAESALKTKESDETTDAEKKALLSKIGEITMSNELLLEKIKKLENGVPFHLRR